MASGGISSQTLGFLTSANQATPYEGIKHGPSGKVGAGSGTSSSGGSNAFLSTLGSVGGRALDILSRPIYAVASAGDEALKEAFGVGTPGESIIGQAGQGLMGESKEDFTQVVQDFADLQDQAAKNRHLTGDSSLGAKGYKSGQASVNPWLKLGLGLAGDIFLDPTTYVGVGLFKDIIQAPIDAAKAAHAAKIGQDVVSSTAHSVSEAGKAEEALHAASSLPFPPVEPTVAEQAGNIVERAGQRPVIPGVTNPHDLKEVTRTFSEPGGPNSSIRNNMPDWMRTYRPQIGFGHGKSNPIDFNDDITKALFIVRSGKKLAIRDREYLKWLGQHFPDETEAELRARGAKVYSSVIEKVKTVSPGESITFDTHVEALSKASQHLYRTHEAVAAARDTTEAINAVPTAASQAELAKLANQAAKGDPYLEPIVGRAVENATADVVPLAVRGSERALQAGVDGEKTGVRAVADVIDKRTTPVHDVLLGEAARMDNPKNAYITTGGKRLRERGLLKYVSHTAGMRNTARVRSNWNASTVEAFQTRGREMAKSLDEFSQEDREASWLAAKNGIVSTAAPEVATASKVVNAWIDRLVGKPGISHSSLQGTTDINEFSLGMKDLNAVLPKAYHFTNKVVTLKDGRVLDFSGPGAWKDSWQLWAAKDPIEALNHLGAAITKAAAEKSWYGSLVGAIPGVHWASDVIDKSGKVAIEHPLGYTDGMLFDSWLAPEVQNWQKAINEFRYLNGKGWQFYDKGLNAWKSVATIVNPAHHVRNFIGDGFLSFMNGMTNPAYYGKSARVLSAMHKFVDGFEPTVKDVEGGLNILNITKPGGLSRVLGESYEPKDAIATIKLGRGNKEKVSIEQVFTGLANYGVLPHYQTVEDLAKISGSKYQPLFKGPFNGKVMEFLGKTSEAREHFERVAYFLYRLEHPRSGRSYKSVREAFEEAAFDTKRVHPTNQDLTQFERTVMRRVMPFYAWTRNSTPAIITAMAERPGRAIAYYKFNHALAQSQGINQPSISQQFPSDQAFPNWMRQGLLGPSIGGPGGYTIINPSEPTSSIFKMITDPIHFAFGQLTPAAQIPMTLASGSDVSSGAPIYSPGSYINKQTPITNLFDRIFNVNIGPGSLVPETKSKSQGGGLGLPSIKTPAQRKAPENDWRGLINWLTGAGMLNTGQYVPGANVKAKSPFGG